VGENLLYNGNVSDNDTSLKLKLNGDRYGLIPGGGMRLTSRRVFIELAVGKLVQVRTEGKRAKF
jgi:hypothetical protein